MELKKKLIPSALLFDNIAHSKINFDAEWETSPKIRKTFIFAILSLSSRLGGALNVPPPKLNLLFEEEKVIRFAGIKVSRYIAAALGRGGGGG